MLKIWKQTERRRGAQLAEANTVPLLSVQAMQRELMRERLRSTRSGANFAVLALHLKSDEESPVVAAVQKRIRMTDTAGYMNVGEIGILLPETSEAGAWKLAEDLLAMLPPEFPAPWCEVYTHPPAKKIESNSTDDADNTSPPRSIVHPAHATRSSANGVALEDVPLAKGNILSAQSLFAQQLPLWKRTLDVTGAGLGLLLLSPVMIGAALAVKLSSRGPIFYAQEREGLGAKSFLMFKFRTMVVDADAIKRQMMHLNEQDGPAFKIEHDPRVTKIGLILRKTSIDELPQLINVLRGEMSLVGPRPLPVEESQACAPWQRRRLDVTPGLTCIWQIRDRRSKIPFSDWVRMDVQYIQSRSLRTDVKLILQTMATVLLRWRYR